MEKTVRVLSQSPLLSRDYTDSRSGEQKKFYSVALRCSDGLDEFVAEMTGDQALNAPTFNPQALYNLSAYMTVREWTGQSGQPMMATSITVRQVKTVF